MPRKLFYFDVTTRERGSEQDVTGLGRTQLFVRQYQMEIGCPHGSFVADSANLEDMVLVEDACL